MTTDEDRDRLAEQLVALPVYELVDVLRRVLPQYTEDHYGSRTELALAQVTDYEDEPGLQLELVAWPDRDYYDGGLGIDQGLWESGHCAKCDTEVASNAKRAFCPYCGSRCDLT
ncbi:zinc ribbon domain-containing protein [Micromonospora yasonensis]|uniref:zinc ribbon domain-containing protein n=1 Tax=Micromonospora yasonensis TaxID=1128667 RepID=UPI0022315685|nr:zinc ribbon domain-containing protein [Micromonospora yasonensis]MCW3844826.1 zinc ribbon domain-containing protein [Micromonospora yasonensis]